MPFIDGVSAASVAQELELKLFCQPLSTLVTKMRYFRRLERAWKLIETDYANAGLDLETAARSSGVSKNHLNVLLRQTTSFTFHQLLTRYRLFQAIRMMQDRNHSMLAIALQNGFGSLNSFQRNFRTLLRATPKQFKKIGIIG